jgi:hypothetical protein
VIKPSTSRTSQSWRTNASSQWTKFVQHGDEFLWDAPVGDVNNVGTNNGVQTVTVTVPTGIQVNALFGARADYGSASCAIWFSAFDVANVTTGGPLAMLITGASTGNCAGMFNMRTSTLGQFRFNGNSPNSFYSIATFGWIDRRGRDT